MTKYRVTGSRKVHGHAPGSVFEADLDENQERRLLASGALTKTRSDAATHESEGDHETKGKEGKSDG